MCTPWANWWVNAGDNDVCCVRPATPCTAIVCFCVIFWILTCKWPNLCLPAFTSCIQKVQHHIHMWVNLGFLEFFFLVSHAQNSETMLWRQEDFHFPFSLHISSNKSGVWCNHTDSAQISILISHACRTWGSGQVWWFTQWLLLAKAMVSWNALHWFSHTTSRCTIRTIHEFQLDLFLWNGEDWFQNQQQRCVVAGNF